MYVNRFFISYSVLFTQQLLTSNKKSHVLVFSLNSALYQQVTYLKFKIKANLSVYQIKIKLTTSREARYLFFSFLDSISCRYVKLSWQKAKSFFFILKFFSIKVKKDIFTSKVHYNSTIWRKLLRILFF